MSANPSDFAFAVFESAKSLDWCRAERRRVRSFGAWSDGRPLILCTIFEPMWTFLRLHTRGYRRVSLRYVALCHRRRHRRYRRYRHRRRRH